MKTLDIHDKNPKEVSSLVEQFIDTDERPIEIITDYQHYSKIRKAVGEILNRKRSLKEMKFYCLYNTPYITWRIYK
jgi:hypothetical protein